MPRGTTKRRPITVSALLDAAMDLFAEQGYGATSIPDICARAGLTKGAFYSNFANRDALFLALLDRSWERRAESIRQAIPLASVLGPETHDAVDARQAEASHARGARRAAKAQLPADAETDRQWTLVSTEFSLHAIRQPEVAKLLVEHEVRVRSELATLITEAFERTERVPTIPIDHLACMVVAVTEGSRIQVLTNESAEAVVQRDLGPAAVAALLWHFSVPTESMIAREKRGSP